MDNDRLARRILDEVRYVVLATAARDGRPWANPVWFAHDEYRALYWVSAPDSRHSLNIRERPELAMTVFDSTAMPNHGQAVYLSGRAEQVADPEHGIEVFSHEAQRQGMAAWDAARVTAPARLRLFRAEVGQAWILDPDAPVDARVAVAL